MADSVGQSGRVVPAEVAQVYNFRGADQSGAAGCSRCAYSVEYGSKHAAEGMCHGRVRV